MLKNLPTIIIFQLGSPISKIHEELAALFSSRKRCDGATIPFPYCSRFLIFVYVVIQEQRRGEKLKQLEPALQLVERPIDLFFIHLSPTGVRALIFN